MLGNGVVNLMGASRSHFIIYTGNPEGVSARSTRKMVWLMFSVIHVGMKIVIKGRLLITRVRGQCFAQLTKRME
jgi:hypothetical protein